MTPTIARNLYDRITAAADPLNEIRKLVNVVDPVFEDDYFDCKQEPEKGELAAYWSKVLSGFANGAGGVLVWGLDARKRDKAGVDAVSAEMPIANVAAFESRLRELQPGATDPPLGEVAYQAVRINGGDSGFLVCYIPSGPHKPYRQQRGNGNYYCRLGGSFVVMPRHVLQLMFYPRVAPQFIIEVEMSRVPIVAGAEDNYPKVELLASITNAGTGTGRDVWVNIVRFYPGNEEKTESHWFEWQSSSWEGQARCRKALPIHPGTPSDPFARYRWRTEAGLSNRLPVFKKAPRLALAVYGENVEPQYFGWKLPEQVCVFGLDRPTKYTAQRLENRDALDRWAYPDP